MDNVEISENREATLMSIAVGAGAVGTYIATQPIPDVIKVPVVTILGAFSIGILAYWKAKVNKVTL